MSGGPSCGSGTGSIECILKARTVYTSSRKNNRSSTDVVSEACSPSQLTFFSSDNPGSSATSPAISSAINRYDALSMLPECALIRPITHGMMIPLAIPMLLISALPATAAVPDK